MENINIVLGDENLVYAKALIQAFQRANVLSVNYILVTEEEKLAPYMKCEDSVLFLITKKMYEDVVLDKIKGLEAVEKDTWKEKIILLSDSTEVIYEDVLSIYKYQAAGEIIKPVKKWIDSHYNELAGKREKAKIIAVMELASNDTSSLLGHAIAKIFSQYRRVLLVNMELFPYLFDQQQTTYSLSDYIYTITTKSSATDKIVEGMQYKNGALTCVSPVSCFRDLYELEEKFTSSFIERLNEDTEYDLIVFVLDYLQPCTLKLLSSCDRIISLELNTYVARQKREVFYQMLELEEYGWLRDKIFYYPMDGQYMASQIREDGEVSEELKRALSPLLQEVG